MQAIRDELLKPAPQLLHYGNYAFLCVFVFVSLYLSLPLPRLPISLSVGACAWSELAEL